VNVLADNIVGVKLLLDPSQEKPLYLPTGNVKAELKKLPKDPIKVAADFIKEMYTHALKEISAQVPKNYMALCQKQFVLSGKSFLPCPKYGERLIINLVPAVWSDKAKVCTLQVDHFFKLHDCHV